MYGPKVNITNLSDLSALFQNGSLSSFFDPERAEGRLRLCRGRKVRTPQGTMPRNPLLESGMHAGGCTQRCSRRPVPQKTNRPACRVRVKRWGKSPPPQEQSRGHGKPHWEQDQIGSPGQPVPLRFRVRSQQINDPLRSRRAD